MLRLGHALPQTHQLGPAAGGEGDFAGRFSPLATWRTTTSLNSRLWGLPGVAHLLSVRSASRFGRSWLAS